MNRAQPKFIDGPEPMVNIHRINPAVFTMTDADLAEMTRKGNAEMAAKFRRVMERGRGALAAESVKANPRGENEVLWQTFNGDALEARFAADDIDGAIALMLGDPGLS